MAGSERSGYSVSGYPCDVENLWHGNVAHGVLLGILLTNLLARWHKWEWHNICLLDCLKVMNEWYKNFTELRLNAGNVMVKGIEWVCKRGQSLQTVDLVQMHQLWASCVRSFLNCCSWFIGSYNFLGFEVKLQVHRWPGG